MNCDRDFLVYNRAEAEMGTDLLMDKVPNSVGRPSISLSEALKDVDFFFRTLESVHPHGHDHRRRDRKSKTVLRRCFKTFVASQRVNVQRIL